MGSTAPWRQLLSKSLDSNSSLRHATYFQLATVRPDGRPANRTVVFRGFMEGTNKLQVTTDSRTHKVEEIRHCPYGEVCWYFTDSWEQFRIQGKLDIIDETDTEPMRLLMRERAWFASSPRSRLQFLGPQPALPVLHTEAETKHSLDPSAGPVGTFCLLTLDPEQVDYLDLKNNQRIVFKLFTQSNGIHEWMQEEVNP
ncbi:hypothetical protein SUGI_1199540 [Cryptomeria japonica]|uniref:pyridoxine/pyridoxamine 5'-phosphate oxidase 2 n=1 Tax=Cryptomeria japonica TaxID=3369 RepID=UPI002414998F|nr:pyridoxine/pyridoxamine 5'-phosphate oxidase 2 [Cryptomeria japonica]GLJ55864.1 hypothetical protein SUGI_1199540 [Cryptomeria japonica]